MRINLNILVYLIVVRQMFALIVIPSNEFISNARWRYQAFYCSTMWNNLSPNIVIGIIAPYFHIACGIIEFLGNNMVVIEFPTSKNGDVPLRIKWVRYFIPTTCLCEPPNELVRWMSWWWLMQLDNTPPSACGSIRPHVVFPSNLNVSVDFFCHGKHPSNRMPLRNRAVFRLTFHHPEGNQVVACFYGLCGRAGKNGQCLFLGGGSAVHVFIQVICVVLRKCFELTSIGIRILKTFNHSLNSRFQWTI